MIGTQLTLLKREIWEHKSIYVVPLVVALIMALTSLMGQATINNLDLGELGIIGASNMPEGARATALSGVMIALMPSFVIAMMVLVIFYALDALYAERKDRSILFWRSIPVTDVETVLSKLLTAVIAIPLVTFAVVVVTHLIVLTNLSIWVDVKGGSPWHLIWTTTPFVDNWAAIFTFLIALPLWMSPFIGWFLFVSAFSKRSPLLVAMLPIAVLPLLEKIIFGSGVLADAFFMRTFKMPLFAGLEDVGALLEDTEDLEQLADANLSLFSVLDLPRFFGDIQLWTGFVVCALFVAAAVYVRRFRDDS